MIKRLTIFAAVFVVCVNALFAKDDPCLDFGKNIVVFSDLEKLFGKEGKEIATGLDMNGDGVKDRVVLLSINNKAIINDRVKLINPFSFYQYNDDPFWNEPHLAIGIIRGATQSKPCEKFIIYGNLLFGKWNGDPKSFYRKSSDDYALGYLITLIKCPYQNDEAKGDELCFTTEGRAFGVYWNGKEYVEGFYMPDEGEP